MSDVPGAFHVRKESVAALVRTRDQVIVGQIHVQSHKRLKDELNLISDHFIAVTDARVYDGAGTRLLQQASFMLVAQAHIVSVTPLSAITGPPESIWLPRTR